MIPDGRVGDSGEAVEVGRRLDPDQRDEFMPELRDEGCSRLTQEPRWHGLFSWASTSLGFCQTLEGNRMATGIIPLISPQTHRRIDQITFPGLLAAAALMARRDRGAGALILMTAVVEDAAHLTTDYPPVILRLMSFRTHNRIATAHGALVIGLGLDLPGLSRRGGMALCALGSMPIALAAMSDTRGPQVVPRAFSKD
jgi:hypothetical protein